MQTKKTKTFRFLSSLIRIFATPKYEFIYAEEVVDEAIIVGNHVKMNGPLAMQLRYPNNKKIWAISEVFDKKEFPDYAMRDFWPNKKNKKIYRFIAKILAPLSAYIFKYADAIPVYRDHRFITTARATMKAISEKEHVIIFPEYHQPKNQIINDFLKNYIDVARLYYAKYKRNIKFYPMYIAPTIKKICIGKPIVFDNTNDFELEKEKINKYLQDEITNMAYALPKHIVVPYENLKKKDYPRT